MKSVTPFRYIPFVSGRTRTYETDVRVSTVPKVHFLTDLMQSTILPIFSYGWFGLLLTALALQLQSMDVKRSHTSFLDVWTAVWALGIPRVMATWLACTVVSIGWWLRPFVL